MKSSRQLLEFRAETLDQMVEILSAAEARTKDKNEDSYGMDIATESARSSKEWMTKGKCFNCGEVSHIAKQCSKPKKSRESQESDEKGDGNDDKKASEKASNRVKMKKTKRQQARAAKEGLESNDEDSSDSEAAYLAREADQGNIESAAEADRH
jgi:hypothetical protein